MYRVWCPKAQNEPIFVRLQPACSGSRHESVKCVTEKSTEEQDERDTRCCSDRHANCRLVHHELRPLPQNIRPELRAVNLLCPMDGSGDIIRCYTVPIRRGGEA